MLFDTLTEIVKSAGFEYIGVRVYSQSELDCVVRFGNSRGYSGVVSSYAEYNGSAYCFLYLAGDSKKIFIDSNKQETDFVIPFPAFKDFFLNDKSADVGELI